MSFQGQPPFPYQGSLCLIRGAATSTLLNSLSFKTHYSFSLWYQNGAAQSAGTGQHTGMVGRCYMPTPQHQARQPEEAIPAPQPGTCPAATSRQKPSAEGCCQEALVWNAARTHSSFDKWTARRREKKATKAHSCQAGGFVVQMRGSGISLCKKETAFNGAFAHPL